MSDKKKWVFHEPSGEVPTGHRALAPVAAVLENMLAGVSAAVDSTVMHGKRMGMSQAQLEALRKLADSLHDLRRDFQGQWCIATEDGGDDA